MSFQAEVPLVRLGQPEGEIGFGQREGGLLLVELEVEARAAGLDVGEAGRGPAKRWAVGAAWLREA